MRTKPATKAEVRKAARRVADKIGISVEEATSAYEKNRHVFESWPEGIDEAFLFFSDELAELEKDVAAIKRRLGMTSKKETAQ